MDKSSFDNSAGPSDSSPSREAASAAAQLAATCISTLQTGPKLEEKLEQTLTKQIEQLLDVSLAVGETLWG